MIDFLRILGYILIGVSALIIWVIIIPRSIYLEYYDKAGFTVKLRVFIFKVKVYPFPNINIKFPKKKKKAVVSDTEQKPKNSHKNTFKQIVELIPFIKENLPFILQTAKGFVLRMLNAVSIKDVSFTVPIEEADPYQTQKKYSVITTSFYGINVILQKYIKISYKNPMFVADFAGLHRDSSYFYCKIQANLCIILTAGLYLFNQYRKLIGKKLLKENKNGRKTNTGDYGVSSPENA